MYTCTRERSETKGRSEREGEWLGEMGEGKEEEGMGVSQLFCGTEVLRKIERSRKNRGDAEKSASHWRKTVNCCSLVGNCSGLWISPNKDL